MDMEELMTWEAAKAIATRCGLTFDIDGRYVLVHDPEGGLSCRAATVREAYTYVLGFEAGKSAAKK